MKKQFAYFLPLILILLAAQPALAQMKSDPSGTWGGALAIGIAGLKENGNQQSADRCWMDKVV